MTMTMREMNQFLEMSEKHRDFCTLALLLMHSAAFLGGSITPLADSAPRRVADVLKAAVEAGRLEDAQFAGNLSDYRSIAEGFIESLRQASVFDRLLASGMRKLPFRTRTATITAVAIGSSPAEALWSPITLLGLDGENSLDPRQCQAIVALSKELLKVGTPGAVDYLGRELRRGVVAATDLEFLSRLQDGISPYQSVGQNASAAIIDLRNLVDHLATGADSRIFFVTTPANCKGLAFARTLSNGDEFEAEGWLAFPQMTPLGGTIAGVPVLCSDQLADGVVMAIDATGIAGNSDIITLSTATKASLAMTSDIVSGAQQVVSLFQTNSVALRAFRYFAFDRLRDDAVAWLEDAHYNEWVSEGQIQQSSG